MKQLLSFMLGAAIALAAACSPADDPASESAPEVAATPEPTSRLEPTQASRLAVCQPGYANAGTRFMFDPAITSREQAIRGNCGETVPNPEVTGCSYDPETHRILVRWKYRPMWANQDERAVFNISVSDNSGVAIGQHSAVRDVSGEGLFSTYIRVAPDEEPHTCNVTVDSATIATAVPAPTALNVVSCSKVSWSDDVVEVRFDYTAARAVDTITFDIRLYDAGGDEVGDGWEIAYDIPAGTTKKFKATVYADAFWRRCSVKVGDLW